MDEYGMSEESYGCIFKMLAIFAIIIALAVFVFWRTFFG